MESDSPCRSEDDVSASQDGDEDEEWEEKGSDYSTDSREWVDTRLDEQKKEIVKSILKQMKAGTPIYRCSLPIFALEPRSLLEKLSDFICFSPMLLDLNDVGSAEGRFLKIVRFYLAAWHRRPKGVKNPFNPTLGEVFRCHCNHEDSQTEYIAEQISHHPPASAFCVYNLKKRTVLESYLKPSTKFRGNSVEAVLQGSLIGHLLEKNETYEMNYPKHIVRGVLVGKLSLELGGKVVIQCQESGYVAELEFSSKKGARNSVSGFIKKKEDKEVLYCLRGKWDDIVFIADKNEKETVFLDVNNLPTAEKQVKPIDQQESHESRRVWEKTTAKIQQNNEEQALAAKSEVEEEQRKARKNQATWVPRHFEQIGEQWGFSDLPEFQKWKKEKKTNHVQSSDHQHPKQSWLMKKLLSSPLKK